MAVEHLDSSLCKPLLADVLGDVGRSSGEQAYVTHEVALLILKLDLGLDRTEN